MEGRANYGNLQRLATSYHSNDLIGVTRPPP